MLQFENFLAAFTKAVLRRPRLAPRCTGDKDTCTCPEGEEHVYTEELLAVNADVTPAALQNVCRDAALMLDYYLALCKSKRFGGRLAETEFNSLMTADTQDIVADLLNKDEENGRGGLHVIRFKYTATAVAFQKGVDTILRTVGESDLFAVLQNTSKRPLDADQLPATFRERAAEWRGEKLEDMPDFPSQFEDLNQVPCLLMIVGKGRLGDTFPASMRTWDLRPRYSTKLTQSTFEQDAGRCFGYTDCRDGKPKIRDPSKCHCSKGARSRVCNCPGRPMLLLSGTASRFNYNARDRHVAGKGSRAAGPAGISPPAKRRRVGAGPGENQDAHEFNEFLADDDEDDMGQAEALRRGLGRPAEPCTIVADDDADNGTMPLTQHNTEIASGKRIGTAKATSLIGGRVAVDDPETGEQMIDERGDPVFKADANKLFEEFTQKRSIIFYAPPQSGKTGAFIYLLKELFKWRPQKQASQSGGLHPCATQGCNEQASAGYKKCIECTELQDQDVKKSSKKKRRESGGGGVKPSPGPATVPKPDKKKSAAGKAPQKRDCNACATLHGLGMLSTGVKKATKHCFKCDSVYCDAHSTQMTKCMVGDTLGEEHVLSDYP